MTEIRTMHVDATGIDLAYQTFGDPADPAVVLVMGLGTQMLAWPEPLCQQLADAGLFIVRFDNRDIGQSTHLDDLPAPNPIAVALRRRRPPYTLADLAEDTLGLLDGLGLSRAHLVGASMGGFVAQHVALRAPERIASLTLIMTSTGARRVGTSKPAVVAAILRRKPAANRDQAIEASLSMLRLIGSPDGGQPESDLRSYAGLAYDRGYDPAGGARQLAAVVAQPNRTRELGRLRMPTLIMHGLSDPLVSYSGGLALARAIPGARFVGFHGMGHDLPQALWPAYAAEIVAVAARSVDPRDRPAHVAPEVQIQ